MLVATNGNTMSPACLEGHGMGIFFILMPPEMDVSIGSAGVKIQVPFPLSAALSRSFPEHCTLSLLWYVGVNCEICTGIALPF